MWLSESRRKSGYENTEAAIGVVGSGTDSVLMPSGLQRVPKQNETQLRLTCSDGTSVLLGTVGVGYETGLAPGEIFIKTDNASITIKNNGTVSIDGAVKITGSLTLNGVSLN